MENHCKTSPIPFAKPEMPTKIAKHRAPGFVLVFRNGHTGSIDSFGDSVARESSVMINGDFRGNDFGADTEHAFERLEGVLNGGDFLEAIHASHPEDLARISLWRRSLHRSGLVVMRALVLVVISAHAGLHAGAGGNARGRRGGVHACDSRRADRRRYGYGCESRQGLGRGSQTAGIA